MSGTQVAINTASAESYECKKGLAEDPTSSLLQPGHNQFHSIHIHQIFIRYSSGIHQTNQVLRISALENNGNNGSHCNRNRVTSCHIRAADPQADFPIVSGNARLRLWLRQPDVGSVGSVGSGWKLNGINMEPTWSNFFQICSLYDQHGANIPSIS